MIIVERFFQFVRSLSHLSPTIRNSTMKRSVTYFAIFFIMASSWAFMKFSRQQFSERVNWFTDISIWYLLIIFGCYCLAKLGYDLLTFNDYPKEIKKLEQDIINAHTDLKKRGYK